MTRCDHCPIGPGCIAERTGHRRYCDWATMGGVWLDGLRRLSREPSGPSLATMAAGVTRATAAVAVDLITGQPVTVDEAEVQRRLNICATCAKYDPQTGRCQVCGCFAALKARLTSGHCPLDPPRW